MPELDATDQPYISFNVIWFWLFTGILMAIPTDLQKKKLYIIHVVGNMKNFKTKATLNSASDI